MAKLIIKRTSEWSNRLRDMGIYLDGEKIGVIGNAQTKDFDIEPGEHKLQAKIDWCGSQIMTFHVTDAKNKEIELSGFKFGKWLMPIALLLSIIYLAFGKRLELEPILFLLLIVPLALYLIYHLTLGRNKYLRLKNV